MNDALPGNASKKPPADISTADRLLCQLLSLGDGRKTALRTLEAIEPSQWSEIVQRAERYQLAAALYDGVQTIPAWAGAPEALRARLHRKHLLNSLTAVNHQLCLGQVLSAFADLAIPVIALKGAYLAEMVYPNASERLPGDIDLLAPKEQIEQAIETLRSLGYHSPLDHPAQEDFDFHHHAPPFEKEDCTVIELHWDLVSDGQSFPVDLEGVWQRAYPVVISGAPVLSLSPEDLLLHLCIHSANHRLMAGLRTIYDIALTVERFAGEIDWEVFAARARQWQAVRSVFLMLKLAENLFAAPLPAPVLEQLQPDDFDPMILSLAYRLAFGKGQSLGYLPTHVVVLQTTPGAWEKLRILLGRFFPPVGDISLHFGVSRHSWRVWLYYPLRWRELFAQQFKWVWKLWRGDPLTHQRARADQARLEQEEHLWDWLNSG